MTTLEQYENMLRTNKDRLDEELEIQAELQYRIGAEVARLNSKMIEAKDKLARIEGEVIDRVKERDSKATVDQAKARMLADPHRQQAWSVYQELREVFERWTALYDAWVTKGYKMADLGALFAADYFAVRTVNGNGNTTIPRAQEERRAAVREASSASGSEVQPRRRRAL